MISFQEAVMWWCEVCHGKERARNCTERSLRFTEESIELAQAAGLPKEKIYQLVEYVYSKPVGSLPQEVGGVMVTLAAMCSAFLVHMQEEGETELRRIWTVMDKIREKQKTKISVEIGL